MYTHIRHGNISVMITITFLCPTRSERCTWRVYKPPAIHYLLNDLKQLKLFDFIMAHLRGGKATFRGGELPPCSPKKNPWCVYCAQVGRLGLVAIGPDTKKK